MKSQNVIFHRWYPPSYVINTSQQELAHLLVVAVHHDRHVARWKRHQEPTERSEDEVNCACEVSEDAGGKEHEVDDHQAEEELISIGNSEGREWAGDVPENFIEIVCEISAHRIENWVESGKSVHRK